MYICITGSKSNKDVYIKQSYRKQNGKSSSRIYKKLGKYNELLEQFSGDEKKMKEAQKPFVKRIIAAVIVFLIPIIVNMILSFVTKGNSDWIDCWNSAEWNGAIDVNSDQITTR